MSALATAPLIQRASGAPQSVLQSLRLPPRQASPNGTKVPKPREASRSAMTSVTLRLTGHAALQVAFQIRVNSSTAKPVFVDVREYGPTSCAQGCGVSEDNVPRIGD